MEERRMRLEIQSNSFYRISSVFIRFIWCVSETDLCLVN
jgi:hypothetical protein